MNTPRWTSLIVLFLILLGIVPVAIAGPSSAKDPCSDPPGLNGDLNRDCQYNLLDVVLLVRAIFVYPQDPYPANGDVNCDHYLDVFDVVKLADYVFSNGPAPQPCPEPPSPGH